MALVPTPTLRNLANEGSVRMGGVVKCPESTGGQPADRLPASVFDRMQFKGQWRDYQQRVLDQLDSLLADERLHVVAAPGSGKTVLGLEIMRRLGRPALILAP